MDRWICSNPECEAENFLDEPRCPYCGNPQDKNDQLVSDKTKAMKSYFDKHLRHTDEASRIIAEIEPFLTGIYCREHKDGFNVRELVNLIVSSATMVESTTIIKEGIKLRGLRNKLETLLILKMDNREDMTREEWCELLHDIDSVRATINRTNG